MADQKVFISWSGELSRQVAGILSTWIPNVIQQVTTWISTDDIDKGSIWFREIDDVLKDTNFGIVCVTRENMSAPWMLFESGALSKGLQKSRVCTLLVDHMPSELDQPLSQFNATLPKRDDMLKLINNINTHAVDSTLRLPESRVEASFDIWWKHFEEPFQSLLKDYTPKAYPKRSTEDMLVEILQLTRSLHNAFQEERSVTKTFRIPLETNPNRPITGTIEQEVGLSTSSSVTTLSESSPSNESPSSESTRSSTTTDTHQ